MAKKVNDPGRPGDSAKYKKFRSEDKGGRGAPGTVGVSKKENYSVAPRVGGTAPKSQTPLKGATRAVVKASKKLFGGAGSGASKQAKASVRRMR